MSAPILLTSSQPARMAHRRPRSVLRRPRRGRRGTVLLEFAMVLPLFLFLVLFSIDMGRYVLVYGAVSDATYIGARAAAQYGTDTPNGAPSVSREAFNSALANIPFIKGVTASTKPVVSKCASGSKTKFIVIQGTANVPLITPGLGALLQVFDPKSKGVPGTFPVTTRAAVLCEVFRS